MGWSGRFRLIENIRGERSLRRRCRQQLRSLGLESPLPVDRLCRRLGEHRRRPIRLVPQTLPVPGPYGAWLATEAADYIVYQRETTKSHQDHIILHEIGHMLAGHHNEIVSGGFAEDGRPAPRRQGGRAPTAALYRNSYDDEQEREAELIATIILQWASVADRVAPRPVRDRSLNRVQEALGDRRGWL